MKNVRLVIILLFILFYQNDSFATDCSATIPQGTTESCDVITQYGISWTLSGNAAVGQFVNGDFWCIGPVTVVSKTPAYFTEVVGDETRHRHGAMLNPSPLLWTSEGFGTIFMHVYSHELNIAAQLPYTIAAGNSLVGVETYTTASPPPGNSMVKAAMVLTVLESAPTAGSFRPAYSATDKTVEYNIADADLSIFKNLATVTGAPTVATATGYMSKFWLDYSAQMLTQRTHPVDAMPEYGAWLADKVNVVALMLNTDLAIEDKRAIFIGMAQFGIDSYSNAMLSRSAFGADGGHGSGRKLPILLVGLAFNDQNVLSFIGKTGDYLYSGDHGPGNPPEDMIFFSEDDQTFYVTQLDVDITNSVHPTIAWKPSGIPLNDAIWNTESYGGPYASADIGLPDYGIRHAKNPEWTTKTWLSNGGIYKSYRDTADPPFAGTAIVAHIMGIKDIWNHQAFFDFCDRRVNVVKRTAGYIYNGAFVNNMWSTYRNSYPPVWSPGRRLFSNVRVGEVEP